MTNFYVRLVIVILIIVAAARFIPEAVNAFLLIVLAGLLIMNSGTFAKLVGTLNLKGA